MLACMDTLLCEIPAPVLKATNAVELGRWGEDLAAWHLTGHGYTIIARNWRCRYGELDIVAMHPTRGLVVIEVKTRRISGYVPACEAISSAKLGRLRRLLGVWLQENSDVHPRALGLDLLAISVDASGSWFIQHIEDIS